ncbi:MAG TPA: Uma2 family endonuclease [Acidimicrobiales bacterium]
MRTVVLGPMPSELTELVERRRRLGLDLFDEVWSGEYHVVPAPNGAHADLDTQMAVLLQRYGRPRGLIGWGIFNLGEPTDFRVPDRGLVRTASTDVWHPTAALVVEILSPHDESLDKLSFYLDHGVEEVVLVDPAVRKVTWLAATDGTYVEVDRSTVLDELTADIAAGIVWP